MPDFFTTAHDNQQSLGQVGSLPGGETGVDFTAAEWFCRRVGDCAKSVLKRASTKDGFLVLSSFGERSVAGDAQNWTRITPKNQTFAAGESDAMAELAVAWAKEPGRNVYVSMVIYPCGLDRNKRGKATDALGVFGLGADLDRDKGCVVRIADLPLPPSLIVSSSQDPAENFNLFWLFDRLIAVEQARPIAKALADLVGDNDGGTADPTHVWRVPGTLNWPKKAKAARGRPFAPQPVCLYGDEAMR